MNIRLIVYRIAQIIQMTDKILKNEIEMIVWALIPFLIDECRDFLMMNHCRDFLIDENDECRDFAVFVKFLMKKFLELLIEMKMKKNVLMKKIIWENSLLLTIREISVSLMIVEMIFLSEVIVLQVIDLETMILVIDLEMMILEI
jgi:hypothetical protein